MAINLTRDPKIGLRATLSPTLSLECSHLLPSAIGEVLQVGRIHSVGYAVVSNVIIYAQLGLDIVYPDFDESSDDVRLTEGSIGIGMTYYLPSDLYLSGTVSATRAKFSDRNNAISGVALSGLFGREWWLSDNGGLGLGAQFSLGAGSGLGTMGLGLVGSATFN